MNQPNANEICELCEVEYDLAEGENYIDPDNRAAIEAWHVRGHVGRVFEAPTLGADFVKPWVVVTEDEL